MAKGTELDDSWLSEIERLKKETESFFKDYEKKIDHEIFNELLPIYYSNVDKNYHPDIKGLNTNYVEYIDSLYSKTIFTEKEKILDVIDGGSKEEIKKLAEDPIYSFYNKFYEIYSTEIYPVYDSLNKETIKHYRVYMKGLMEMQSDKILFPDANFTMRVSYGKVKGSYPRDGIMYKYYTTLDGVIEKDNPNIYDYDVPDKLKELYQNKDYGKYEVDGTVPLCFLATNHTTGGNSGSPVLNADGHLIGINFDRAWEGVMSDLMFNPEQCRNISLDMRYVLFIVDKMAGAGYLLNEMTIVE